ncbi:hypothetical protein ACQ4PT_043669 [Festuca glaucescens]
MARFSGSTVLLILVATVSVYTCVIIAGASLGRALDRPTRTATKQPPARDIALRISVSFRGLAEDFAKELWGGYHKEEGRSGGRGHAGAGDRAAASLPSSAARASVQLSQAYSATAYHQHQAIMAQRAYLHRDISRGDEGTAAATQPAKPLARRSNFSDEIGAVKVGPWGGSGGQPFYMRGGGGAPRLLSVTLYHADAVHGFRFEYLLGGVRRTMGPSAGHYSGSKGLRATINFESDEHLAAVEGTFGRCRSVPEVVVTSLKFRTDKGRTYGPYGEETGTPFSIPAADGCIVGFWGRSGWLLDAIGVYIMPCQVYEPTFFVSSAYKATS